jgi:hypothetical protein
MTPSITRCAELQRRRRIPMRRSLEAGIPSTIYGSQCRPLEDTPPSAPLPWEWLRVLSSRWIQGV